MMISDHQARLALDYLKKHRSARPDDEAIRYIDVSSELLQRVAEEIERAPDTRDDMMTRAGEVMAGRVTSDEVAEKLISRLISDAIR